MVVVPAPTPVRVTGEPLSPIVAADVFELDQVPPAVRSLNVVVAPTHTVLLPEIMFGNAFTVTVVVAKQPPADI